MLKQIFAPIVTVTQVATLVYALVAMTIAFTWSLPGMLFIAGAPLVQRCFKLDTLRVAHHKVRLPATSTAVFAGLALILLTVEPDSVLVGLAFLNIGLFLLDTYWREG